MRQLIYPALVLAAGCAPGGGDPPDAYARLSDRMHARFPIFKQYHALCQQDGRRLPDRECLRFDPPRRWRGVIQPDGHSGNRFYPAQSTVPKQLSRERTDAVADIPFDRLCDGPLCLPPLSGDGSTARTHDFAVEFIGRRTTVAGRYGHMGMFVHKIVVDRMIRQQALPPR